MLDVTFTPSETRQAIGRPFRPGQTKKVYGYRLVAAESPQEEDHPTCLKKELISRMWFEWNDYCGYKNFQVATVDVNDCADLFLESQLLKGRCASFVQEKLVFFCHLSLLSSSIRFHLLCFNSDICILFM